MVKIKYDGKTDIEGSWEEISNYIDMLEVKTKKDKVKNNPKVVVLNE